MIYVSRLIDADVDKTQVSNITELKRGQFYVLVVIGCSVNGHLGNNAVSSGQSMCSRTPTFFHDYITHYRVNEVSSGQYAM